jgi:hypothetical protein
MAEQGSIEIPENGAEMDYQAHEKTYEVFLNIFKWGTVGCIALMIAMAIGFYAGGGLIGGTIALIVLIAISAYIL